MSGEKILLLLCIGAMSASVLNGCPSVSCSTSLNNVCYNYTIVNSTASASLYACANGTFCDVGIIPSLKSYTTNCSPGSPPTMYTIPTNAIAGSYCDDGSWCSTKNCTGNTCIGYAAGSTCTSTSQCNPGLYCNGTGFCVTLIPANQACSVPQSCAYGYDCLNGNCTKLFSQADGFIYSSGLGPFCKNNNAYPLNASFSICATAKSTSSPLHACNSSADCTGSYTVGSVKVPLDGNCYCSYTVKPSSYCSTFPGDSYGSKAASKLKSWASSSSFTKNCNIMGLVQPQYCMQNWWSNSDWSSYLYYSWMSSNQYKTANVDTCIKNIIMTDYVAAKKVYDKYDSAAYLAVALLVSLVA